VNAFGEGGADPGVRIGGFAIGFEGSPPAQVVGQVPGRHAVEAAQPLLETRMIGVDGIEVDGGFAGKRLSRGGNHADGNFGASGEGAQRPTAVAHEQVRRRHGAGERLGEAGGRVFGQDGVDRGALVITLAISNVAGMMRMGARSDSLAPSPYLPESSRRRGGVRD